jgi:predicted choloylglycine hydrolase
LNQKSIEENKINFKFFNLQGSHYDVGFQLGKKLVSDIIEFPNIVTQNFNAKNTGFGDLKEAWDLCESYCPGIIEEILGLADGFNVSQEQIAFAKYLVPSLARSNHCSQFVVLPPITENNSIFVGRSYDYHWSDEDLVLLKTKVEGSYAHIGFSAQALGRTEGMNSEGLVVSMTGGGAFDAPTTNYKSFNYTIAIRALLENCKTVEKAVDLLSEMPTYSSTIYLIVDKTGRAALVESIDSKHSVKYSESDSEDQFLVSTNHYTHPDMLAYNKFVNNWLKPKSEARHKILKSIIKSATSKITKTTLKNILAKETPEGVCCLYFEEWFGTLWSIMFDITQTNLDVCFGPPTHNIYHQFNLEDSYEDQDFAVVYENKFSSD